MEPLKLIYCNLYGPIDSTIYGETKYYLLFTNDFTWMAHIYSLNKKSSAAMLKKFRGYKPEVKKQTGKVNQALEDRWLWRV